MEKQKKKTSIKYRPIDVFRKGLTIEGPSGCTIIPSFFGWYISMLTKHDFGSLYRQASDSAEINVDLYKRIYFKEEAAKDPPPKRIEDCSKEEVYKMYFDWLEGVMKGNK